LFLLRNRFLKPNLAQKNKMKTFKKIIAATLILVIFSLIGGYFYFEKKFTPPENHLKVSGFTAHVPMMCDSNDENPCHAIYLPVRIKGIDKIFYMQLDSGSPVTLLYRNSLESIRTKFRDQIQLDNGQTEMAVHFNIGEMTVSSAHFEVLNYGNQVEFDHANAVNIIGTIGTDLFEKRIVVMDFKNSCCSFEKDLQENGFEKFEFRKRKILIPATLENKNLKLLYDSGSSGYELITNKEEWEKYRTPNGNIKKENGNSWGNLLTAISAPANHTMKIGGSAIKLSEVTRVEGTSQVQNLLMKASGMQGMIGNKLFLNHKLILDCKNEKFKVE